MFHHKFTTATYQKMIYFLLMVFLAMGLEQPFLSAEKPISADAFLAPCPCSSEAVISSSKANISETETSFDFCAHSDFFERLVQMGLPFNESVENKLSWLQSQIIGNDAEFDSPFGKRKLIYADHTASGRCLRCNENFIIQHLLPFYGNTHTCHSYVGSQTTKMLHGAKDYIKKCLGSGQDDVILFCGSGTTAAVKKLQEVMGIAVPSIMRERVLKSLSPKERWVIFVGPYEHHSNLLSWRQSLAEVIEIGFDDNGLLDMEALRLQLEKYKKSNRPMLGSFSACSNVNGIYSDTRAIARLLHQYNGFACFDFAASGPYAEIDMRSGQSDGYDAVFLSPHKFLGGPGSPGIILMNKALYRLKTSSPSTCGGGTVSYVNGFSEKDTLYLEDIEAREDGGTPQIIQTIRAALAFWVKEYVSCEEIEKREQYYINRALNKLRSNPNIEILGNSSCKRQAILSFLVYYVTSEKELNLSAETGTRRGKPLHGLFVTALLNDLFGIQARGGCSCSGPYGHRLLNITKPRAHAIRSAIQRGYVGVRPGWTRVSFPYYMAEEDFEFILNAIQFVATYGQRFLPLYEFDLRKGNWKLKPEELGALSKEDKCNIPIGLLGKTLEEINIEMIAEKGFNFGREKIHATGRYSSYLSAAKCIASRLPEFPPERKLEEDIDPNILLFRV